jgi:bacterioferritin
MACAGPILFGNVDMFYTEFIQPYRISEEILSGLSKEERRARVIDVLNQARAMELFAITQYMNQHYGLDSMDYGELAAKMKLIAIDEMRHAEMFAERVKDLGGEPTTSYEGDLQKGQDVHGIYPYDTKLEDDTIDVYSQLLLTCRDNGDSISAKLFETIIEEEQAHMNYFDNVGNHIETLGDTYLSKIAGTSASTGPSTKGFLISGGN